MEANESRVEPLQAELQAELQPIAAAVRQVALQQQGDTKGLLLVLRFLEDLHQEIREGLFQDSLPVNRQQLYALLRDIESSGDWPYINRIKLRSLLNRLEQESGE